MATKEFHPHIQRTFGWFHAFLLQYEIEIYIVFVGLVFASSNVDVQIWNKVDFDAKN